jgi:hypothetical protein
MECLDNRWFNLDNMLVSGIVRELHPPICDIYDRHSHKVGTMFVPDFPPKALKKRITVKGRPNTTREFHGRPQAIGDYVGDVIGVPQNLPVQVSMAGIYCCFREMGPLCAGQMMLTDIERVVDVGKTLEVLAVEIEGERVRVNRLEYQQGGRPVVVPMGRDLTAAVAEYHARRRDDQARFILHPPGKEAIVKKGIIYAGLVPVCATPRY